MKNLLTIATMLLLVFSATTALADRWNGQGHKTPYMSKGERIDRHLDRKGDRIEHRFDRKADRAADRGHYKQAAHFRARGEQINRHLDRRGDRIHARFDRRDCYRPHDRYYVKEKVVYRDYRPYSNRIGVVISQPGLWFGGLWHN